MALGRESPHRSPHISRKVTVSYGPGSHVVQNLSHKQSPPPPPPTIDALPDAVLLRIFHFLQRPFASGPLPKASRLCSIKSATRVSLKTGRQTITVPYEVCVGSVCRRWRMVSYSLPHASVLDLAAYLPVHILLRVSLTERGLDRAYDLFTADPERIRHVRGLNIHCPGVSSVCLKRLLRSCSAVKNLQLILRRGDWLGSADPFDATATPVDILTTICEWLEDTDPSVQRNLTLLSLESFVAMRSVPVRLWHRLGKALQIACRLTSLSIHGVFGSSEPASYPLHILASYNQHLVTLRSIAGTLDLKHLASQLPRLESLKLGDVALARGDLSRFSNLRELTLGNPDPMTWGETETDESAYAAPNGYATGRLLRALPATACARILSMQLECVPLADFMSVIEAHDESGQSLSDAKSFECIIARTVPRMSLANLIVVLKSCPKLRALIIPLDLSGNVNLEAVRRALVGANKLRRMVCYVTHADYQTAYSKGLVKTLETAKPCCYINVEHETSSSGTS